MKEWRGSRERERDYPFTGLFHKQLQWLWLGQVETMRMELLPVFYHMSSRGILQKHQEIKVMKKGFWKKSFWKMILEIYTMNEIYQQLQERKFVLRLGGNDRIRNLAIGYSQSRNAGSYFRGHSTEDIIQSLLLSA